ncbi:hypothetical protein PPYR_10502 [Photinus pyralis]|uniref:ABC transporter domain-containing protein n=1 Tax=Photinus pyralis TaxID=7054 RepID=A0A1Y1M0P3_PHOPY|nr:hypothetical protein PPYR_10502 [Photinus pyralis]
MCPYEYHQVNANAIKEGKMSRRIDKFFLLMWKNFLLQWRHPRQTIVEIMAPVLFCSLLVVVRSLVHPEPHPARFYSSFRNAMPILTNATTINSIAWSPDNPRLRKIMEGAVKAICKDEDPPCFLSLRSFPNSSSLQTYLSNDLNLVVTLAGVQFRDSLSGDVELPAKVDVTLRFPGELRSGISLGAKGFGQYMWKTNLLFPLYQIAGPRGWDMNEGAEPSYYYEGFLKLQQELSYAIIKHFKGNFDRSSVPVSMQRFPYPRWIHDMLLTALQTFIGLIIMLSFVYTCISTVKIITTEKEKQLKEAMKIMGLPNWLHWTAWFVKTFFIMLVTVILMVILMTAKWYPGRNYTVFSQSNPLVIFVFLLFFICATITFCFAISVFFSRANTAATIAGMAWFLSYFPYTFLADRYARMTLTEKLITCLCSNSAMAYGFQLVIMFEGVGEGLQWHNIWKTSTPDDNLTLGYLMLMLSVDCVLYLLIALYVEAVFPGEYGVPKPWYFFVTRSFWCGPRATKVEDFRKTPLESSFYEKEPTHLRVGIKIERLRKEYKQKRVAVRDLSLNMYRDQITVLLGHNGAGKTTTMSMLTGMIPPTRGTAFVDGHDITKDMTSVRSSLGLCPQHNILFDELTVEEHIYFYTRLKGMDKSEIKAEIEKYVEMLELQPKKHARSDTLSGGMKRKLSVGVALCGRSSVVMFDEPTAGMDPAARRALWDLLQVQKKGRTILLTTHFMDEADLLGDRIAIMAGGKLQCCGSSFFLKKKYGAGYHLIMEKMPTCEIRNVTNVLQKYMPQIQVESCIGSELRYILAEEQSTIFEKMFSDLETNSGRLGLQSYGISLTTLEEVFMKIGADHAQEESSETDGLDVISHSCNGNSIPDNPHKNNNISPTVIFNGHQNGDHHVRIQTHADVLKGWALRVNQVKAMLLKRYLSILRTWVLFVIQNFVPVLFLVLAIVVVRGAQVFRDLPNLKIQLESYGRSVTVLNHSESNPYAEKYKEFLQHRLKHVTDLGGDDLSSYMFNETIDSNTAVRLRHIAGATFRKDNSITAWFNNEPYHSPPLALQLVMNSILHKEVGNNHYIQFYNHPLEFTINTKLMDLGRGRNMGFQIAFNIGFSMAFVSSFYVMFYVRERVCKAKHLQFVSGVNVLSFWGPSFLCDLITFIFTSVCVILTLLIFQEEGFSTAAELGRTFSILLYFGFSMLPMMYLASYLFDIPSTGYTRMTLVNIFTGVAGFLVVQVLGSPGLDLEHIAEILHWLFLIIPHYSLSTGIRDINVLYSTHQLCNSILERCINFDLPGMPRLSPALCKERLCASQPKCCSTPTNYYAWEAPGIGRNVIFSTLVGLFLIAILLLIEYRILERLRYALQGKKVRSNPPPIENEDSDVITEKEKIQNMSAEEIKEHSLVLKDVTKYYKNFLAVNRICLSVNRYECFGLLGVNGAGKTSTFKMMTGDVKISEGDAWVNGLSLKSKMKEIHQMIGYCPQFDALLDDLTCKETLIIFSLLRGFTMSDSELIAQKLAEDFDFTRHLRKKVKQLSGGNKRKLSTAVAMIGNPLVLYLDEPTTGMDPATKRYLWNALCKVRDQGTCIVLTSHSMDECEALCTRLAIMVNGSFMCLGSTQHLKSKFSEGYTLIVKVKKMSNSESEELQKSDTDPIEEFVMENFRSAIIREKHQELLTFYICDKSLPWSKMFGIMERGKQTLNIEDYSLGQSSLEQVFLTFTKHQREEES